MKVYIVTSGEYSDYFIEGVFTDRDKARVYCALRNHDIHCLAYSFDDGEAARIEEYESDKGFDILQIDNNRLGTIYYFMGDDISEKIPAYREDVEKLRLNEHAVWVEGENEEKAKKIYFDRRAKKKAESEGL